jgi:hypothetical protein
MRGKDEWLYKGNDLALFLSLDWFWSPESQKLLCIGDLPQIQSRAAKMR